jgi:hypothetical protein
MRFTTVTSKEYENQRKHYASVFDTPSFVELNRGKCDQIVYGFFTDTKRRLGLAVGLLDNWLKLPFSAPYGCFSLVSSAPKVVDFLNAVDSLVAWARDNRLSGITVTLPPTVYNPDIISKAALALHNKGFLLESVDLNFSYDLAGHNASYADSLGIKARHKFRASLKSGFALVRAELESDLAEIYEIIKRNREHRGHPLKMSLEEITKTAKVVRLDAFALRDGAGHTIASAICFRTQTKTAQVIYWGSLPDLTAPGSMNNLAWQLFEYFKGEGMSVLDTGPSTDAGVPNCGLSDFKQSIGCVASNKMTFRLLLS